jgi:hypothetical protein
MKKLCKWCGDRYISHKKKKCAECRWMKFKAKKKRCMAKKFIESLL